MKLTTILGVAAAVGVVLYFRSESGKKMISEYKDSFSDLMDKGSDSWNEISQRVNRFGKEVKESSMQPIEG